MNELLYHCNREELPALEDKILGVMTQLGMRVRAVPSISKQSLLWEAYDAKGIKTMQYQRKYDMGVYKLTCHIIALDAERTKRFYATWNNNG